VNGHLVNDLQVMFHMLRGRTRSGSHRQQLEAFYAPQAQYYDAFRQRLLHGRREMLQHLAIVPDQTIVELGGGTGQNLRFLEYPLQTFRQINVVDLCPSLLRIARDQYRHMDNINIIEADATSYHPGELVDRVWFSYALTMIPEWRVAIDNALKMLKPGGMLGVVDFYISGDDVENGGARHGWLARRFWPRWFAHDGVHLTPAHLQYLQSVCRTVYVQESLGKIPYLPYIKAPYYIYVGQAG
jgi:S-adenosylmethionine-diacylgycerolhomoserine-N-methlytransferase